MRPFVTAVLLAAGGLCLYAPYVDTTPPYLADDEITISLTAHSIATTGRDLAGRSWPLYIQITEGSWFHPVIVYSIALVLQFLPLSEFAIRLPTVCAGVANIVLMYLIGRMLFRREAPAVLAAVLLALTPTHFLHSRFALEYLYPLPFIGAWLLCLFTYLESANPRWLFASTVALGFGFYSYIASVFVMPQYVLLTCLALFRHNKPARIYGVALAGFLAPLIVLFVPWLIGHQPAYGNTVGHYLLYDTSRLNPLQGLREMFSYPSVAARTTLYWGYLNPSFLFMDLTAPFMYSTRTTGVFLLPLALFIPVGLYQSFRSGDAKSLVLVLGFLAAPVAAVLVAEPGAIGRALELLPFGVLLAVAGVVYLWSGPRVPLRRVLCLSAGTVGLVVGVGYAAWTLLAHGHLSGSTPVLLLVSVVVVVAGFVSDRSAWRVAVVALLLAGAFQFERYVSDYFTDYRARAAEAFHFNRRGGLEYVIERSRTEDIPAIYLSGDIDAIESHWKWYVTKHHREDLLSRTVIFGGTNPLLIATVPPKSAILAIVGDPTTNSLAEAGQLRLEALVAEPGGRSFYAVFRR